MDSRNNTGIAISRRHLPNRRPNETFAFDWLGMNFVATISRFDDNSVGEIFLSNGRVNSHADTAARDSAVVASLALQHHLQPHSYCGGLAGSPLHCLWREKAQWVT
jgi:hypothetical protein